LHQRKSGFHHTRPARFRYQHEREFMLEAVINGTSDFFAYHRSHGATDKRKIHARNYEVLPLDFPVGTTYSIAQPGFRIAFFKPFGVFFRIFKPKRVSGSEIGEELIKLVVIKENGKVCR